MRMPPGRAKACRTGGGRRKYKASFGTALEE